MAIDPSAYAPFEFDGTYTVAPGEHEGGQLSAIISGMMDPSAYPLLEFDGTCTVTPGELAGGKPSTIAPAATTPLPIESDRNLGEKVLAPLNTVTSSTPLTGNNSAISNITYANSLLIAVESVSTSATEHLPTPSGSIPAVPIPGSALLLSNGLTGGHHSASDSASTMPLAVGSASILTEKMSSVSAPSFDE